MSFNLNLIDYILWIVLIISLITDLRSRKILNVITLPAILFGLIYNLYLFGWDGFLISGKGFLLGLALLFLPFVLGGIGAGDVKLLAAIGAIKGAAFVFVSFLYTAMVGGLIAIMILILRGELLMTIKRIFYALVLIRSKNSLYMLDKKEYHKAFPYGVAIFLGTLCAYLWRGFYA